MPCLPTGHTTCRGPSHHLVPVLPTTVGSCTRVGDEEVFPLPVCVAYGEVGPMMYPTDPPSTTSSNGVPGCGNTPGCTMGSPSQRGHQGYAYPWYRGHQPIPTPLPQVVQHPHPGVVVPTGTTYPVGLPTSSWMVVVVVVLVGSIHPIREVPGWVLRTVQALQTKASKGMKPPS
jgi:hypothetical protein